MTAHHVRGEVDGEGIATITIDRPAKRNAMTFAMLDALHGHIASVSADDGVRVVILTGAGGSFCAGTDLADLGDTPAVRRGGGGADVDRQPWPLLRCPKPVIAAIDGFAVGMGAELTSLADVRILSTRARLAWNFAQRGLVPDMGAGSWVLPRLIGPQRALRLLYSAQVLEAQEALAIGYAAAVVEPEALAETALAEARSYLSTSPFALSRTKRLVWEGLERDASAHMAAHRLALAECFASDDHREGVASFLERRPARFTGR